MQIYFTTVKRGGALKKAGELVSLDWERKKVVGQVPIYPSDPEFDDPNPRGGGRGGRGILRLNGNLMVASFHTLHAYNLNLEHQYDISHSQFVGLHEIDNSRPGYVWVASTILDLALELNLETGQIEREYWARELPGLQKALDVGPMAVDKLADNRVRYLDPKILTEPDHLHLSAIAEWQGETYALLGVRGSIVNLDRDEVVVADPGLKLGHNLHIMADGTAVVLGTISRTIRCYDLTNGKLVQVIDVTGFKWVKDLLRWRDRIYKINKMVKERAFGRGRAARPFFLRGLDVHGRKLFIGASPACILQVDLDTGELDDTFIYSQKVLLSIHGIKVVND